MYRFQIDTNHWEKWVAELHRSTEGFANSAVLDYLRNGERFRVTGANRILQIIAIPSFDPVISYEVFHGLKAKPDSSSTSFGFHLLRTIWRMDLDLDKFQNPLTTAEERKSHHPTLQYQHATVLKETIDAVYTEFQHKIPMWHYPLAEFDHMGNDGTNYELAFGGFFLGVRYRWWSYKPDEWSPLYHALEKAIAVFEQLCDSQPTSE